MIEIVAAAVRIKMGSGSGMDDLIISMPRPLRHHHVMQRMLLKFAVENVHPDDQGFVTSAGRFAGRKEALNIARQAGQAFKTEPVNGELFSENLW